MIRTTAATAIALSSLTVCACQTAPVADAGFLTAYDGLTARTDTTRASVRERRDDEAVKSLTSIYIEPATLHPGAAENVSEQDVQLVLGEIDRQLCFELSERFALVAEPTPEAGRVRTAVTHIGRTNPAGSTVAAAAGFFIPGPIKVRVPGSTGGLAVESELIGPDGRQLAALAWARNANLVGMDDPSLSGVGDALQFAEPFGDQAGDSLASSDREAATPSPDPCARFGPRFQPGGFIASAVTGLYVPQADGVRNRGTDTPGD